MRIGILTQPLHTNYGGLLQAYALQTVLKNMGHEPWMIQRDKMGKGIVFLQGIKKLFMYIMKHEYVAPTAKQFSYLQQNTDVFVKRYIHPKTKIINSTRNLKKIVSKLSFDGYIVGSDQVWRPSYSPCITNYFLDFVMSKSNIKRIAYAASFGVDAWEFSENERLRCAELVSLFDGVSVRESSGIKLCKEYLGVSSEHVLDPTMLLEYHDYEKIVEEANESQLCGNLFCYFLDENREKQDLTVHIASALSLSPFFTMPAKKPTVRNLREDPKNCIFPSVTKWLRSFMDAEMVLTDSYHGCVFSIIFNKPFWVIGNRQRGMARFQSLLNLFRLENRLIDIEQVCDVDFSTSIDWAFVNNRRNELKKMSLTFLENALK